MSEMELYRRAGQQYPNGLEYPDGSIPSTAYVPSPEGDKARKYSNTMDPSIGSLITPFLGR